jgi:P4 family phage/plasmid primase-like protien
MNLELLLTNEYPEFSQYFSILENEQKMANFYWDFRLGKHKYSKKYLYGFDMGEDTRMLWSQISVGTIIYDMSSFFDHTLRLYISSNKISRDDIIILTKQTNKITKYQNLKNVYGYYEEIISDDNFYDKLNRSFDYLLPISKCNVIDLTNGKVRPISKSDYFTYKCDVEYTTKRSPEMLEIIGKIMCNNEENIKYLQKILGYCLTGDISARVYFILYGIGANGKSMILNLMNKILKEQYQAVSKCVFINNNSGKTGGSEVLQIKDCRMASFSETEANDALNESIIKMISGNDTITARGLYKDPVSFIPQCKLMLCTNFKPDFNANDRANVDRVRLVPFNARFVDSPVKPNEFIRIESIDKVVEQKYMNEFFSWCVDGAIEYYKNKKFNPTGEMLEAQNEYIREQSNITNFIDDTFDTCDTGLYLKSEIKSLYDLWCKENSLKPLKVSVLFTKFDEVYNKSFKCTTKEYKGKWVYKGLKIKIEESTSDLDHGL